MSAQPSAHNFIGAERNALAGHFSETTLVNQIFHRFQGGVSVCNKGFNQSEHFSGGGIHANENTVVDLAKAEQLQNLFHFRGQTNNTTNSNDENNFFLRRDVNLVFGLCFSSVVNGSLCQLKKFKSVHHAE